LLATSASCPPIAEACLCGAHFLQGGRVTGKPDIARAPWIAEQMDIQFGAQGSYLIDFYHLCDYLAAAAPRCSKTPKVWLEEQKTRFKSGRNAEALAALEPYVEPKEQAETPVRNAYRYISKRPGQFDSLFAIEAHLPIGSWIAPRTRLTVLRTFESVHLNDFQIVRFFMPYANRWRA
jgi:hypothetical protein